MEISLISYASELVANYDYTRHIVRFEMDGDLYEALVVENLESTYVSACYELKNATEVDIPEYFGLRYSQEVYSFIYGTLLMKF